MFEEIGERGELSVSDYKILVRIIPKIVPGYKLRKISKSSVEPKYDLGVCQVGSDGEHMCVNPVTGSVYTGETGEVLDRYIESVGGDSCGQFAGASQWTKVGRAVNNKNAPVYTFKMYGRDVGLYAYEQTRSLVEDQVLDVNYGKQNVWRG